MGYNPPPPPVNWPEDRPTSPPPPNPKGVRYVRPEWVNRMSRPKRESSDGFGAFIFGLLLGGWR